MLVENIPVIGPSKAQLEGNKVCKEFNTSQHPHCKYKSITKKILTKTDFLKHSTSYVLKPTVWLGKGVIILNERIDAINVLNEMLLGMFGTSSQTVVIEEFLSV